MIIACISWKKYMYLQQLVLDYHALDDASIIFLVQIQVA